MSCLTPLDRNLSHNSSSSRDFLTPTPLSRQEVISWLWEVKNFLEVPSKENLQALQVTLSDVPNAELKDLIEKINKVSSNEISPFVALRFVKEKYQELVGSEEIRRFQRRTITPAIPHPLPQTNLIRKFNDLQIQSRSMPSSPSGCALSSLNSSQSVNQFAPIRDDVKDECEFFINIKDTCFDDEESPRSLPRNSTPEEFDNASYGSGSQKEW